MNHPGDGNQRYLMAAIGRVQQALTRAATASAGAAAAPPDAPLLPLPEGLPEGLPEPPALAVLCQALALSPFERDVLLLCAGVELSDEFAACCRALVSPPAAPFPTFALALATLPEPHWSALLPTAPLRRHRLIELAPGETLTRSPLRIEERVLHYLTGLSYLDEQLAPLLTLVPPPDSLPDSHRQLAAQLAAAWDAAGPERPLIHLCHLEETDRDTAWGIAAAAAAARGQSLYVLRMAEFSHAAMERETFLRLWERETLLGPGILLVAYQEEQTAGAACALAERLAGLRLLAGPELARLAAAASLRIDVQRPTAAEQRRLWQSRLGPLAAPLNGQLDTLVSHFSLSAPSICAASARVRKDPAAAQSLAGTLWESCRAQARTALGELAQRIEPTASWADLVVPEGQRSVLREIAVHVRHRSTVHDGWGFGEKSTRGLGISALFSGASGTGKTMAAEVLARELALDLYRVDLSQVVSKYIGETEKNLRRVFDRAEQGGVILLFDEADALFGKRSEVKDSHDRYANIEVSYLLSRMEVYRGLSILTTNQKSALDTAFLRRIRFIVHFPFPELAERTEIWRRVFPARTPTLGLVPGQLARLNVAGGNIRNIALTAAFLAADSGEPVQMKHLLVAAGRECAKLDRPISTAEIGGWV